MYFVNVHHISAWTLLTVFVVMDATPLTSSQVIPNPKRSSKERTQHSEPKLSNAQREGKDISSDTSAALFGDRNYVPGYMRPLLHYKNQISGPTQNERRNDSPSPDAKGHSVILQGTPHAGVGASGALVYEGTPIASNGDSTSPDSTPGKHAPTPANNPNSPQNVGLHVPQSAGTHHANGASAAPGHGSSVILEGTPETGAGASGAMEYHGTPIAGTGSGPSSSGPSATGLHVPQHAMQHASTPNSKAPSPNHSISNAENAPAGIPFKGNTLSNSVIVNDVIPPPKNSESHGGSAASPSLNQHASQPSTFHAAGPKHPVNSHPVGTVGSPGSSTVVSGTPTVGSGSTGPMQFNVEETLSGLGPKNPHTQAATAPGQSTTNSSPSNAHPNSHPAEMPASSGSTGSPASSTVVSGTPTVSSSPTGPMQFHVEEVLSGPGAKNPQKPGPGQAATHPAPSSNPGSSHSPQTLGSHGSHLSIAAGPGSSTVVSGTPTVGNTPTGPMQFNVEETLSGQGPKHPQKPTMAASQNAPVASPSSSPGHPSQQNSHSSPATLNQAAAPTPQKGSGHSGLASLPDALNTPPATNPGNPPHHPAAIHSDLPGSPGSNPYSMGSSTGLHTPPGIPFDAAGMMPSHGPSANQADPSPALSHGVVQPQFIPPASNNHAAPHHTVLKPASSNHEQANYVPYSHSTEPHVSSMPTHNAPPMASSGHNHHPAPPANQPHSTPHHGPSVGLGTHAPSHPVAHEKPGHGSSPVVGAPGHPSEHAQPHATVSLNPHETSTTVHHVPLPPPNSNDNSHQQPIVVVVPSPVINLYTNSPNGNTPASIQPPPVAGAAALPPTGVQMPAPAGTLAIGDHHGITPHAAPASGHAYACEDKYERCDWLNLPVSCHHEDVKEVCRLSCNACNEPIDHHPELHHSLESPHMETAAKGQTSHTNLPSLGALILPPLNVNAGRGHSLPPPALPPLQRPIQGRVQPIHNVQSRPVVPARNVAAPAHAFIPPNLQRFALMRPHPVAAVRPANSLVAAYPRPASPSAGLAALPNPRNNVQNSLPHAGVQVSQSHKHPPQHPTQPHPPMPAKPSTSNHASSSKHSR